nr:DUF4352 domain-containing protein [Maliibacterium massiliense]
MTETAGALIKPEAGNVFLLCKLDIQNNSDRELAVSSMMSFACYVDDTKVDISIPTLGSKGSEAQLDGSVAAGKKMSGVLGYEVPEGGKREISFKPDPLKTQQLVFAAEKE